MTATAEIVTSEKRDVLLVPNAALRFSPDASAAGGERTGVTKVLMPGPPRGTAGAKTREVKIGRGSAQRVYVLDAKGEPRGRRRHDGRHQRHADGGHGRLVARRGRGDHRASSPRRAPVGDDPAPCARDRGDPLIQLRGVTKTFGSGAAELPGPARRRLRRRRRRLRRGHGSVGIGQVDDDEHPRLPRRADRGEFLFEGFHVER